MSKRDLVYLLIAITIFGVAGYIGYTQLLPKNSTQTSDSSARVERVGDIPSNLNQTTLNMIKDNTKVQDFNSPVDLGGLGNPAPFGQ